LPAAGDRDRSSLDGAGWGGHYWSSSLGTDGPFGAGYVSFGPSGMGWGTFYRYYGRSVRPVCP
jgi:hypothetical protein